MKGSIPSDLQGVALDLTWQRVDHGEGLNTFWIVRGDPDLTWWRVDCGEGLDTF